MSNVGSVSNMFFKNLYQKLMPLLTRHRNLQHSSDLYSTLCATPSTLRGSCHVLLDRPLFYITALHSNAVLECIACTML